MICESPKATSFANECTISDVGLQANIDAMPKEEEAEKYHHEIVDLISEERTAQWLGALYIDARDEDGEACKCVVARSNSWNG